MAGVPGNLRVRFGAYLGVFVKLAQWFTGLFGMLFCVNAGASLWLQSANQRPIWLSMEKASLVTQTNEEAAIRRQIHQQLDFTIGPLNAMGGGPSLELTTEVTNVAVTVNPAGGFDVSYDVEFLVFWPNFVPIPANLSMVLPAQADAAGLTEFYEAYKGKCQIPNDEGPLTFFYYYRQSGKGCPLDPSQLKETPKFTRLMNYSVAQDGFFLHPPAQPDYRTYWSDGVLDVVAWFGPTEEQKSSNGGRIFVNRLMRFFNGAVKYETSSQTRMHTWKLEFRGPLGPVRMLVLELRNGTVLDAPAEMGDRFKTAAAQADLVLYAGHSGYGEQLRTITHWSTDVATKDQFHYLHGCDVGSYLDGRLLYHPTHRMEVVANATSGYFGYMVPHGFRVFRALVEGRVSLLRLLSQIPVGDPVALGPPK